MMSSVGSALSLLASMTSQYTGTQGSKKAAPTPPSVTKGTTTTTITPAKAAVAAASNGVSNASNPAGSNQPNTGSNMCDVCLIRPKYHDGVKLHPFCGRGCAAKVKGSGTVARNVNTSSSPNKNCDHCQSRPKYVDGGRTHSFCSKACAQDHKMAAQKLGKSGLSTKSQNTCRAPRCHQPVFMNSNGTPGEFCSISHKTLVETACLICCQATKQPNSHFCSQACIDKAEDRSPAIVEVPAGHVMFNSVVDQFKASWRHTSKVCPKVKNVYKILSTSASLADYDAYRTAVEARGHFVAAGRSAGNENRRWHGTQRECHLGDPGNTTFCSSSTCSLCCIVKTSFDLSLFGKKTGWGRFGKGIYTSSTSSKSNDYSSNVASSPLKAILLNKVVVGKGYKMTQDSTSLSAPPNGYDSVLAEKGGSLNYDELVVYTNDAIRPSFLVMYDA